MKLLILLLIVTYYTLRCNDFAVKNHLFDSGIFPFIPTRRMGMAIITVLALQNIFAMYPVDTGRKLNVHKTFRRRPGRFYTVYLV